MKHSAATLAPRVEQRLPYGHLNLRYNPFGELGSAERAELAVVDLDQAVEPFRQPRQAVQFLGSMGRGKTTHLLALARRVAGAAYVRVEEGQRPVIPEASVLLIDEAQRLPRWRRLRLFRRVTSLALASLQDFSRELQSAGLSVTTVRLDTPLEPAQAGRIFHRRIEAARRGPGPLPAIGESTLHWLVERYGSDVRAMESHLYEVLQDLQEIRDV